MKGALPREALPRAGRKSMPRELAAALGNALRIQILLALADREPLGVRDLADRLEATPSRVRHHLERLRSLGFVESSEATPGAAARKLYRLAVIPTLDDAEVATLDDERLRRFSVELLRRFVLDGSAAIVAGTFFRRPDFGNTRVPVPVDARGWAEIAALSRTAAERIERVKATAAERMARREEEPINAAALILWFEVPVP